MQQAFTNRLKENQVIYLTQNCTQSTLHTNQNVSSLCICKSELVAIAGLWMRTGQQSNTEKGEKFVIIIVEYSSRGHNFKIGVQQLWRMKFCRRVRSPQFACLLISRSFAAQFVQFVLCLVSSNSISIYHIIIIIFNSNTAYIQHTQTMCLCVCDVALKESAR